MIARCVSAGLFAALAATSAAADSAPTLLGSFKDWSAFQSTSGNTRVCYASSKPKSSEPKKAARDEISFLISDWPGRKVKAELMIVPGYPYKDGSSVTAQIGAEKFELFTENDAKGGTAWVADPDDERRVVAAMSKGAQVVVTGVSRRGTTTKDTYSLGGISAALDKVHEACGM